VTYNIFSESDKATVRRMIGQFLKIEPIFSEIYLDIENRDIFINICTEWLEYAGKIRPGDYIEKSIIDDTPVGELLDYFAKHIYLESLYLPLTDSRYPDNQNSTKIYYDELSDEEKNKYKQQANRYIQAISYIIDEYMNLLPKAFGETGSDKEKYDEIFERFSIQTQTKSKDNYCNKSMKKYKRVGLEPRKIIQRTRFNQKFENFLRKIGIQIQSMPEISSRHR